MGASYSCRSITNFRGALVLARNDQPVESRTLVRLIFENFFFVAALCDHGLDFVKEMRSDEAANRKTLGELSLKGLSEDAKDGEHAQIIRTQIRRLLTEFPKPKKFGSVSAVAAATVARHAYLSYAVLSMDAHPSITTLRRHFEWELEGDTRFLTLNVVPRFTEKERLATVDEACNALWAFVSPSINFSEGPRKTTPCASCSSALKPRAAVRFLLVPPPVQLL